MAPWLGETVGVAGICLSDSSPLVAALGAYIATVTVDNLVARVNANYLVHVTLQLER